MNFRQLEVFRAVMLTGTTSAAAQELRVSQPAVSNMIRHIEELLGLELFERKAGRLIPTSDAITLRNEIEPLFLFFRSVDLKIQEIRSRRVGSMRITATPSCANSIIPGALSELFRQHAGVQVSIDTRRMEEIVEHLIHNVADLGVTLTPAEHPSLISTPIRQAEMVCIVPREHELAVREIIAPQDLSSIPFIAMERGTPLGKLIAGAFASAGAPLNWAIETRFCNTACSMVEAGAGCAIVDGFVLQGGTYRNLVVRPFRPRIELYAYATVSKHRPTSWLTKAFLSILERSPSPTREML